VLGGRRRRRRGAARAPRWPPGAQLPLRWPSAAPVPPRPPGAQLRFFFPRSPAAAAAASRARGCAARLLLLLLLPAPCGGAPCAAALLHSGWAAERVCGPSGRAGRGAPAAPAPGGPDDAEYRSGEDDDADDEATLEEEERRAQEEGENVKVRKRGTPPPRGAPRARDLPAVTAILMAPPRRAFAATASRGVCSTLLALLQRKAPAGEFKRPNQFRRTSKDSFALAAQLFTTRAAPAPRPPPVFCLRGIWPAIWQQVAPPPSTAAPARSPSPSSTHCSPSDGFRDGQA
jgi:hypothetical protein